MFDRLYERAPATAIEAARLNALALANVLHALGITVDCLPLLDVRQPGADDIIGDRALGAEPMRVAALGRAILDGLRAGGVVGVVKHIPGHGRALCDSHKDLPRVTAGEAELASDLAPFTALNEAPMAMTAHIVYEAWDADHPATQSETVIRDIIRNRIGFDGLLMTDDLDMEALSGSVPERARLAIAAGCDVALNCWAKMDDMVGIAEALADHDAQRQGAAGRRDGARFRAARQPRLCRTSAQRDALIAVALSGSGTDGPRPFEVAPTAQRREASSLSNSTTGKGRSTCCSLSRAARRSTSRRFRSSISSNNISASSPRRPT